MLHDALIAPFTEFEFMRRALAAVIALCLLVAILRRSVLGQQMLAVRANERAAAAAGIVLQGDRRHSHKPPSEVRPEKTCPVSDLRKPRRIGSSQKSGR